MKSISTWILLAAVGLVLWFLIKKSSPSAAAAKTPPSGNNIQSGSSAAPFWEGWNVASAAGLKSTTANVQDEYASIKGVASAASSIFAGISSLWSTKAQGAAAPTTSGSGAGVPVPSNTVNNDASNSGFGDLSGFGDWSNSWDWSLT